MIDLIAWALGAVEPRLQALKDKYDADVFKSGSRLQRTECVIDLYDAGAIDEHVAFILFEDILQDADEKEDG